MTICQLVEEVALLQVELGLQCGKDSVERILGVVGGQAGVVKETVIRGVMIRMEDIRIAGAGSRDQNSPGGSSGKMLEEAMTGTATFTILHRFWQDKSEVRSKSSIAPPAVKQQARAFSIL